MENTEVHADTALLIDVCSIDSVWGKERELADIERRYPSEHYFLFDDKLRILTAIKQQWQQLVTTVFVRQGHYALDLEMVSRYPAADITIDHISEALDLDVFEARS